MAPVPDARTDLAGDDLGTSRGLVAAAVIGSLLWIVALALSVGVKLL
jgi:hypothetical protein